MIIPRKRETDSNSVSDQTAQPAKRSRKTGPNASDRNGTGTRKTSAAMSSSEKSNAMEVDMINGHAVQSRNIRSRSASEIQHDDNVMNGNNTDTRMEMDADVPTPGATTNEPVVHERIDDTMPPLIHTLTNGDSIGVQVAPAKVANLSPSTSILSMSEDPHVTKIGWRPGDKSILITSGQRTCAVWRLAGANLRENGHAPGYLKYQVPAGRNLISGFAWQPTGRNVAVATCLNPSVEKSEDEVEGSLHIFDDEMKFIESLPSPVGPLTTLKSPPSGSLIVGLASNFEPASGHDVSSTIAVWNISDSHLALSPATLTLPETLIDIDTVHKSNTVGIYAAGGHTIYHCTGYPDLKLENKWSMSTSENDTWSLVRCLTRSNDTDFVVAASGDTSRIWLPNIGATRREAHTAPITGLEIRPRLFDYGPMGTPPEFATSSIDGNVIVWQCDTATKDINLMYRLNMDQFSSIMSISYSPDGFCLAGASYGDVDIWNAEHGYNLMASWQAEESEWAGASMKEEDTQSRMSSIHGDAAFNGAEHRLAWDADSKKLAFALGSQVSETCISTAKIFLY